jgi:nitrite reductase/ring-hydroxylating ferredoxin subunit
MERFVKVGQLGPATRSGDDGRGPLRQAHGSVQRRRAIFATNAVCPQRAGPLANGRLDDSIAACPWHGWPFAVRSGQPIIPVGTLWRRIR